MDAVVGTQACSSTGRTVLEVVHESTRESSFRAGPAHRNPENPVHTSLTPDICKLSEAS